MPDPNITDIVGQVVEKYGAAGVAFYFIYSYVKSGLDRIDTKMDKLIALCNQSFGVVVSMARDKLEKMDSDIGSNGGSKDD